MYVSFKINLKRCYILKIFFIWSKIILQKMKCDWINIIRTLNRKKKHIIIIMYKKI